MLTTMLNQFRAFWYRLLTKMRLKLLADENSPNMFKNGFGIFNSMWKSRRM